MVGMLNVVIGNDSVHYRGLRVRLPFQQREGLCINLNAQGNVMTARKDGQMTGWRVVSPNYQQ